MKRLFYLTLTLVMGVGVANAAVRSTNSPTRTTSERATISRAAASPSSTVSETRGTTARATPQRNTVARTGTVSNRNFQTSRTTTASRSARSATPTARTAALVHQTRPNSSTTPARSATTSRGTITLNTYDSVTFGTGYNTCRDAYFTCMDQFCSTANDTYRRCICSSKLPLVQSRERALAQASDQIQDFINLNLSVIDKTASEVNAMLSASSGELAQSVTNDSSAASSQLSGIRDVLSGTKKQSLSTQGTLDIAGDINSIWATTDLTGGVNLSNLVGEQLYNAVHAQCSALVADRCPSETTQTMVVSAYGMYIENDCSLVINALDKKLAETNNNIRATEREMNHARLKNYDSHNSSAINDCIAQVRRDITADAACGADYIHCLDITGLYLNISTGQPIYSPNFYQLTSQISLSGDVLTNQTNRLLVAELNRKRIFAERGLDTCRDIADAVWDEFLRQAITEIYQGQQERIRTVRNECLDVVNNCYDTQTNSLKDFSNVKDQMLLGSRLELSEEMCREKLDACSNLYGGGPSGLTELLVAMKNITSLQISNDCTAALVDFTTDLCSPPSNDSLHSYPYACRVYAPGEQKYAENERCNTLTQNSTNSFYQGDIVQGTTSAAGYSCGNNRRYTECNAGYYITSLTGNNKCLKCPEGCYCEGGTEPPAQLQGSAKKCPLSRLEDNECGSDYAGSLYQQMIRYAKQVCVRPSESTKELTVRVMQDINMVMDKLHTDMATSLSAECSRWDGVWVDYEWTDDKTNDCVVENCEYPDNLHDITGHELNKRFYDETGANTKWGYCANKDSANTQTDTAASSVQETTE